MINHKSNNSLHTLRSTLLSVACVMFLLKLFCYSSSTSKEFLYQTMLHSFIISSFALATISRHLAKEGITVNQPITNINILPEPYGKFIQQLSKFSLHALNNNQLIFTLGQIKQLCPQIECIPEALDAFGLLQAIELVSIFQTTTTLSFVHLSIQEFLAANHITTLTPDEELSILNEYFWTGRHSNMFTIYIALTRGQQSSFRKFLSVRDDKVAVHSKFLGDVLKCIHLY